MAENESKTSAWVREPSSFRDPHGFVYSTGRELLRRVNRSFKPHYDHLIASGLYERLAESGKLLRHEEVALSADSFAGVYKTLRPARVPFISYPYEWCFGQLKDAALLTLKIQKTALDYGMWLKDASAYNIQFVDGKPVLIDTLSLEKYPTDSPWVAYRQFCQHFLAPLVLMSRVDIRLGQLLRSNIDGVPLDLASRLMPTLTRLRPSVLTHIHFHSLSQQAYAGRSSANRSMSLTGLRGLLDNLSASISGLTWDPSNTVWSDYSSTSNYSSHARDHKTLIVKQMLDVAQPSTVWDIGANTGVFSRVAANTGARTIAFDLDPGAVELNYREVKMDERSNILPLIMDITNPSPGLGWLNKERKSLCGRGPANLVMALALVHHLAIGHNLPLGHIADCFSRLAKWLVVEFVPKSDSQVQRMLASREDIFPNYARDDFETAFASRYHLRRSARVEHTERTIYLFEAR